MTRTRFFPSQDVIIRGPHPLEGMRGMVRWAHTSDRGTEVCVWIYALNRTINVPPHALESYRARHDSRRAEGWNNAGLPL